MESLLSKFKKLNRLLSEARNRQKILAFGYLGCTEIFTLSLSLTGLLLSASNVLSSSPQAHRSGRGALRRGPERGLSMRKIANLIENNKILQNLFFQKKIRNNFDEFLLKYALKSERCKNM